jgi:hypothetical protein
MALYRESPPNVFRLWTGEKIGGVSHPLDIETAWLVEELEALKLFVPAAADPVPAGRSVSSTSVKRVEGTVRFVHELAPVTMGDLFAYAALRRWEKEIGGISVAGVPVATDDRAKQMIIGARVAADADPEWATIWVGANGDRYPVNAAAMIAISNAVQAHVNACFTTYADVAAAIESGQISDFEAIDGAFS